MKHILWILVVLILTCGWFAVGYALDHSERVYEGIGVFTSQEELQEFTEVLVLERAGIRRFNKIMENPIIIDFEVTIKNEAQLKYGQIHYDKFGRIYFTALFGIISALLSAVLIWKD